MTLIAVVCGTRQTFLLRTEMALVCIAHDVQELDERTSKHLEHAERLFGEIDTNNSKVVSTSELKVRCSSHGMRYGGRCVVAHTFARWWFQAFLNRVGLIHTPRQFKTLMRVIDVDQTRSITFDEFQILVEYGAECVHKYREFLRAFGRQNDRVVLGDVFEYVVQEAGACPLRAP